jgi:hypothetical protein
MRPRISATESMSRASSHSGHAFDQRLHMVDAVAQQGRGRHHGIGPTSRYLITCSDVSTPAVAASDPRPNQQRGI